MNTQWEQQQQKKRKKNFVNAMKCEHERYYCFLYIIIFTIKMEGKKSKPNVFFEGFSFACSVLNAYGLRQPTEMDRCMIPALVHKQTPTHVSHQLLNAESWLLTLAQIPKQKNVHSYISIRIDSIKRLSIVQSMYKKQLHWVWRIVWLLRLLNWMKEICFAGFSF